MFNIFIRTIKDKKWTLFIYCFAVIIFLWMYIALFPSFQKSVSGINQYLQTLPEGFLKAFGFEAQSFGTLEGFLGSEQYSFIWPILIISLVVSMANFSLAGEKEKGTIAILLSQPISRTKIFLEKFFSAISYLVILIAVSVLVVFPLAEIYNIPYKSVRFLKLGVVGLLFGLAILGLSFLASSFFSEKSKVSFTVVGTLVLMYFLNIVSGLKENLEKLKYLSFFHYFKPSDILIYNKINHWVWWIFLGTFFITTVLALILFDKKDISI